VGFAVGIIIEQANRAIVLEDLGIFDGLKRSWEIFRANVWPLIVMGLILYGITLVLGIVIALPIFIVVFPTIFALAMGEGQSFTPLYVALACICLYAPVSWMLNGILTTFTQSAWTLTYLRLTQKPEISETPVFAESNA
jgi:Cu/Ag efflux pump CusA